MLNLRQRSYTLSKASEAEIIAQLSRHKVHANVTKAQVQHQRLKVSMAGGHMYHRIRMYIDRLRRRLASYAQAAALTAKNETDFAQDVYAAFPRARKVSVPRRILKSNQHMEAAGDSKADFAIDNVDDDTWNEMLDSYMNEYVPKTRSPEYIIEQPSVTGEDTWYAWEFERDLTNEFVQAVRDGQIAAANENGITDFVWIAVVDDRTDQCCLWRDGLLVSEIEEKSADHEGEDDDCNVEGDGLTPPIHFNCRCTLAPATENIPERPDDGAQDFEEWLNS